MYNQGLFVDSQFFFKVALDLEFLCLLSLLVLSFLKCKGQWMGHMRYTSIIQCIFSLVIASDQGCSTLNLHSSHFNLFPTPREKRTNTVIHPNPSSNQWA